MRKYWLCAVLLLAGLCACDKDSIDIDQLSGSWYRTYPEGVIAEGSITWIFGADYQLQISIYDVFSNNTNHFYFSYRVSGDGKLLTLYESGGDGYVAQFGIGQCSRHRLVLTRLDCNSESDYYYMWSESYTFQK